MLDPSLFRNKTNITTSGSFVFIVDIAELLIDEKPLSSSTLLSSILSFTFFSVITTRGRLHSIYSKISVQMPGSAGKQRCVLKSVGTKTSQEHVKTELF